MTRRPLAVAVAGALLAAPGCVLPIAPEFQENENLPPFVISAMPDVGTVVTKLDGEPKFSVIVEDPNGSDRLYVRWLVDYPPYDRLTSKSADEDTLPPASTATNRHSVRFSPNCFLHNIAPTLTRHRLMLVMADRPFIAPEDGPLDRPLDPTGKDVYPVRLVWFFDMECR